MTSQTRCWCGHEFRRHNFFSCSFCDQHPPTKCWCDHHIRYHHNERCTLCSKQRKNGQHIFSIIEYRICECRHRREFHEEIYSGEKHEQKECTRCQSCLEYIPLIPYTYKSLEPPLATNTKDESDINVPEIESEFFKICSACGGKVGQNIPYCSSCGATTQSETFELATERSKTSIDWNKFGRFTVTVGVLFLLLIVVLSWRFNSSQADEPESKSPLEEYRSVCEGDNYYKSLSAMGTDFEREQFTDYCYDWLEWLATPP